MFANILSVSFTVQMMLTPAMQGVILAIAKARHVFDKDGPEAGLIKVLHVHTGHFTAVVTAISTKTSHTSHSFYVLYIDKHI